MCHRCRWQIHSKWFYLNIFSATPFSWKHTHTTHAHKFEVLLCWGNGNGSYIISTNSFFIPIKWYSCNFSCLYAAYVRNVLKCSMLCTVKKFFGHRTHIQIIALKMIFSVFRHGHRRKCQNGADNYVTKHEVKTTKKWDKLLWNKPNFFRVFICVGVFVCVCCANIPFLLDIEHRWLLENHWP